MRILSWNVNRFENLSRENNVVELVNALSIEEFDVLCLQNVHFTEKENFLKVLQEKLHLKNFSFSNDTKIVSKDGLTHFLGNVTLSNHDIADGKDFHVICEGTSPKSMVYTKIIMNGSPVHIFNLHLCPDSEPNRLYQMSKFHEVIKGIVQNDDCFVCGTFNCLNLLDYTHEQWMALGYFNYDQNLATEFVDYMSTMHYVDVYGKCKASPTILNYKIGIRVDYIWMVGDKWKIIECHRILNKITKKASTHLPIVAEFAIPPRKYAKLDVTGKWLVFPGYTCLSFLNTSHDLDKWMRWYADLGKIIPKEIYQIVPFESLHMTVRNLFTLKHFSEKEDPHREFHDYVSKTKRIMTHYINNEFTKEEIHAVIKTLQDVVFGYTLLVDLTLDNNNLERISKISKSHEDVFPAETKKYHMTLAYKKDMENGRKPTMQECQAVVDHLKNIPRLIFFNPTLCYFPDMSKFIPMKSYVVREKYKVMGFCSCKKCWPQAGRQTNGKIDLNQDAVGKICLAPPSIPAGTIVKIPDLNLTVTVCDHLFALQRVPAHSLYIFIALNDKSHESVSKFGEKHLLIEYEYFGK